MKICVFPCAMNKNDGSARIRVYNLVKYLETIGVEIALNDECIDEYDIVIFQRNIPKPCVLYRCKILNIFTVYDIDDYHKHKFKFYHKFDLIIASTKYMREVCLEYNRNIFVVENSIDFKDCFLPLKEKSSGKNIGWFGGVGNLNRLKRLNFNLVNITTITKGGDIEFNNDTIDDDLKKFDLIIIPQEKNIQTLCKTHCRMLKAIYLGIPCLVSDMPEFMKLAKLIDFPEEFIVRDLNLFEKKMQDFLDEKIVFNFDFEKARKVILEHYSVELISNKLISTINEQYILFLEKIKYEYKQSKFKVNFAAFFIKFILKVNYKTIDKIAWWIPVRKWRQKFRAKFQ